MNTDKHGLISEEKTQKIIGFSMEVLKQLGLGLLGKPHENALAVEFRLRGIPFRQQPRFKVNCKGLELGEFIPDLIVFDQVVVDTKVISGITDGEILNYPKNTGLKNRPDQQF